MSDGGHRTSTIARPGHDAAPARRARPSRQSPSRSRADLTTPIPRDKQLARGRPGKLAVWLVGLVVVAALAAALFVLPVRAWIRQQDDLAERQAQLDVLEQANARLQSEVDRLETAEGIEEAAREELGYTAPGEQRVAVQGVPAAPTALPAGWPYDQVGQIIAIRTADAAAVAAAVAAADGTADP